MCQDAATLCVSVTSLRALVEEGGECVHTSASRWQGEAFSHQAWLRKGAVPGVTVK